MTIQDFMDLDWNDSHVGYDLLFYFDRNFYNISYISIVIEKGESLKVVLVTEDNFSPFLKGTGPLSPREILDLKSFAKSKLVVLHQGEEYDLSDDFKVNGIDEQIAFYAEKDLTKENWEDERDY